MMKKPHLWPSLCALAVSSVLSPIAFAADNKTRLKEEEPLEHISVTGSHIKRTDLEGASPMTVLTDEHLLENTVAKFTVDLNLESIKRKTNRL